jgi:DNA (cytosine-5)-methyltransferase 1
VIGGPPCQRFTPLARLAVSRGQQLADDLTPEFERIVFEAQPRWWVMENVPEAPIPEVAGYVSWPILVNNRTMCGGVQERVRRITFGTHEGLRFGMTYFRAPVPEERERTVTGARMLPRQAKRTSGEAFEAHKRLQGLPVDFDLPGMTASGKLKAIGNGVPFPTAYAVARAVREAIGAPESETIGAPAHATIARSRIATIAAATDGTIGGELGETIARSDRVTNAAPAPETIA